MEVFGESKRKIHWKQRRTKFNLVTENYVQMLVIKELIALFFYQNGRHYECHTSKELYYMIFQLRQYFGQLCTCIVWTLFQQHWRIPLISNLILFTQDSNVLLIFLGCCNAVKWILPERFWTSCSSCHPVACGNHTSWSCAMWTNHIWFSWVCLHSKFELK